MGGGVSRRSNEELESQESVSPQATLQRGKSTSFRLLSGTRETFNRSQSGNEMQLLVEDNIRREAVVDRTLSRDALLENDLGELQVHDEQTKEVLKSAMRGFFYMSDSVSDFMETLVGSMHKVELEPKNRLIGQGEKGDIMYVLFSGKLAIIRNGKKVDEVSPGEVVGELALLYEEARSATVESEDQPCVLYSLTRKAFKRMQMNHSMQSRAFTTQRLREAPCLHLLRGFAIRRLAAAMKRVTFQHGESIIREGQALDRCYLLESGHVAIVSTGMKPEPETVDKSRLMHDRRSTVARTAESAAKISTEFCIGGLDPFGSTPEEIIEVFCENTAIIDNQAQALPGCLLGKPLLLGVAQQPHGDPFVAEENCVVSSFSFRAISEDGQCGSVRCSYFTIEDFENILGPMAEILTKGIEDEVPEDGEQHPKHEVATDLTMKDFECQKILGAGAFGKVILARCMRQDSGIFDKKVALKILAKDSVVSSKNVNQLRFERQLLEELDHPFVLKLEGYFQEPSTLCLVTSFRRSIPLFQILYAPPPRLSNKWRGGSKENKASPACPDSQRASAARFWGACTAAAIGHLHAKGIAYRDLKPENLLVDENGYIILIDLGFAKKIPYVINEDGSEVQHDMSYTLCGTFEYLAPEFFFDGHGHTNAVDHWALGCLLYEMVVGRTPFVDYPGEDNVRKLIKRICMTQFTAVSFPTDFDKFAAIPGVGRTVCRSLVSKLLRPNPSERLGNLAKGMKGITGHSYFEAIDWAQLEMRKVPSPWMPPSSCYDRPQKPMDEHFLRFPEYLGDPSLFSDW